MVFSFARQTKPRISSEVKIRKGEEDEHPEDQRMDPNDPSITDEFISQLHLGNQYSNLNTIKYYNSHKPNNFLLFNFPNNFLLFNFPNNFRYYISDI